MITNERQYRITKAEVKRFEKALEDLASEPADRQPKMRKVMQKSMESQLEELRENLAEYEALRSGKVTAFEVDSLDQLPLALIKARIARGLTQKQLADAMDLKEQQIQRYEATLYEGADLERLQAVAEALGARERVTLELMRT